MSKDEIIKTSPTGRADTEKRAQQDFARLSVTTGAAEYTARKTRRAFAAMARSEAKKARKKP